MYTKSSLVALIFVIIPVFLDVVILDGLLTKVLDSAIKNSLPIDLNKTSNELDKILNQTKNNNNSGLIIDNKK